MITTKRTLFFILLVVLVMSTFLVGCSKEASLLGKWKEVSTGVIIEFLREGILTATTLGVPISGTYKVVDDTHLQIALSGLLGLVGNQIFEFSVSGDTLTLKSGATVLTLKKTQ